MIIKSGPVVFSTGQRGIFITEEDLARAGTHFQFLMRISYEQMSNWGTDFPEIYKNVFEVLWHLKDGQSDNVVYDAIERQLIEVKEVARGPSKRIKEQA